MLFINNAFKKHFSRKNPKREKLDILFIVAGCPGSGKSTIIKSAYRHNIHLFGETYHRKFSTTCTSPDFEEYDEYTEAITNGSIFQAAHLRQLKRDPSPPDSCLLHIDLKGVVRELGHTAATKPYRQSIRQKTNIPLSQSQMADPEICDLMITGYLSNPLFRRFKRILINTVYTDFRRNSNQLLERVRSKGSQRRISISWQNLSFKTAKLAQKFHTEVYKSWERNIHLLKPEKILFTSVNTSGHLLINNTIACSDWEQKVFLEKRP